MIDHGYKETPFWKFWDTTSGVVGGMIAGCIIMCIIFGIFGLVLLFMLATTN